MANDLRIPGYTIISKYKEGGSAAIFKARKHPYDEIVALKVLLERFLDDKEMVRAFEQEARILESLKHPNIIGMRGVVDVAPRPTIELEFFESDHLKWVLRKRTENGARMDIAEVLRLIKPCVVAIGHLHDLGIAHRDIKPENILVDKEGKLRLIDFSLAEHYRVSFFKKLLRGKPKLAGTLTYLSPEQIERQPPDHRSDFYSLGVVLFELFTGAPPFKAHDQTALIRQHLKDKPPLLRRVRDDAGKRLEDMLAKMLEKRPERRQQSTREILSGIDAEIGQAG